MKKLLFALGVACLAGCTQLDLYHDEPLPALENIDYVTIKTRTGHSVAVKEIADPDQVERLILYVNSLPNKWGVPWENPPVGQVFFNFYRKGSYLSNFFVGPNFFGRTTNNSFSQPATEAQIRAVGEIAGFDLWTAVGGPAFSAAPKK